MHQVSGLTLKEEQAWQSVKEVDLFAQHAYIWPVEATQLSSVRFSIVSIYGMC